MKHTRKVTKQSRSNGKAKNDEQQSKAHTQVKPSNTNRGIPFNSKHIKKTNVWMKKDDEERIEKRMT